MEKTIVPYKNNILIRIKNKILSIFKKKDNKIKEQVISKDEYKNRILNLYNDVKNNKTDLNLINQDDLIKIMLLYMEEISLTNDKISEEISSIKNRIQKIKIAFESANKA